MKLSRREYLWEVFLWHKAELERVNRLKDDFFSWSAIARFDDGVRAKIIPLEEMSHRIEGIIVNERYFNEN